MELSARLAPSQLEKLPAMPAGFHKILWSFFGYRAKMLAFSVPVQNMFRIVEIKAFLGKL